MLMQLRKVCNHPDLFEGRPIVSSFDMPPFDFQVPSALLTWRPRGGGWGLGAWAVSAGWEFTGRDLDASTWAEEAAGQVAVQLEEVLEWWESVRAPGEGGGVGRKGQLVVGLA